MSIVEGIGDEVTVFAAFILIIILAATVTFFLNVTPIGNGSSSRDVLIDSNSNELVSGPGSSRSLEHSQSNENRANRTRASDFSSIHYELIRTEDQNGTLSGSSEAEATDDPEELTSEGEHTNTPIYPTISDSSSPSRFFTIPSEEGSERSTEQLHSETDATEPQSSPPPPGFFTPPLGGENVRTTEQENLEPGEIHVRLKSLDDTERTVVSFQTTRIIDFKRAHFSEDLENNRTVRLIFSGQLLQDTATLLSYGINENCVIHVQILSAQARQTTSQYSQNSDLDLSHLLWPLLSVILGICWILYFKYPDFFNLMSLGMLFLFTGSFVYFYSQVHNR
ncbi:transmembrane and ubiquitin-like domain-containing protein 1 [Uloborus diversus]|uniref:transmembrane and ubiquitin-like domain-containing protein 1 n=1 Tax=Uloborus diversus TaxID=327109 RepID=UPI00240900BD|nr:transmembrane and ubiquitin-like domain-containing protein 1 [Uloborus diversus]